MTGQFLQHCDSHIALIAPLYADAYRSETSESPFFLGDSSPYLEFTVAVGARKLLVQVFHLAQGNREYYLVQVGGCSLGLGFRI